MGDELLCVGAVDRAADIPGPNRLTEVGWECWRAGCAPAGRLAVRLPRWVGRPERLVEAPAVFAPRSASNFSRGMSRRPWSAGSSSRGGSLRELRASLEPGVKNGQVAFVLASFPSSFAYSVAHRLWLDRVLGELEGFPLVAGFWSSGWYTSRLIDGLKQRDVALCLYDAPHAEGLPPSVEVLTAGRVYLRLLGRNREAWDARRFGHAFDYRYTEREIVELLPRVEVWMREANTVGLVFANGRWAGESAALLAGHSEFLAAAPDTARPLAAGHGGAACVDTTPARAGGALGRGAGGVADIDETVARPHKAPP